MRHFTLILACLGLACLGQSCTTSLDPSADAWSRSWRSESASPVFTKLDSLEEGKAIGSPDVAVTRSPGGAPAYRMAYAQGGTDDQGRIGLAESADGKQWTRLGPDGAPSILVPAGHGHWDGWFLDTPAILQKDGVWYLWYFGADSNQTPGGAIGLATSSDGLHFDRAQTSPVLQAGAADAWDALWVESPSVIWDGRQFVMYYTGVDQSWRPRVGRATSPDGITWTKDSANPVLDRGPSGAWDSQAAAVPGAVLADGQWQLFYCSQSELETTLGLRLPKIGLANSADGSHFSRYGASPVLDGGIDGRAPNGPYNPCVVFDPAARRYWLWYESGLGFGLASAPALPGN